MGAKAKAKANAKAGACEKSSAIGAGACGACARRFACTCVSGAAGVWDASDES